MKLFLYNLMIKGRRISTLKMSSSFLTLENINQLNFKTLSCLVFEFSCHIFAKNLVTQLIDTS